MMRGDIEKSAHASHEAEARSKLKSQFELFSQPLPTEAELFAMWGDSEEVLASIACATFEHGPLLNDAIRSFLLQKTKFRFEIVLRDDASTDGTRDLIADYMQRYPRIIRARIYDENQFKLGVRPADDWVDLIRGKYIAICEGDDFWIDQNKLQDQVTQLEKFPEAVISVAGSYWYHVSNDSLQKKGLVEREALYEDFPPQYHHTSTFLIERQALVAATAKRKKYEIYGDTALRHLLLDQGKCICLPRVVSIYWVNGTGIWSSLSNERKARDHVHIFAGLIKAVSVRRKASVLRRLLGACAKYFPFALRRREWRPAVACLVPFILIKTLNVARKPFRILGRRPHV